MGAGCGDDGDGTGDVDAADTPDADPGADAPLPVECTPENFQEQVLVARCGFGTCHDDVAPSGPGLDLISPNLETRLVGVNARGVGCNNLVLVTPQDPDNSYLFQKVQPAPSTPDCGSRMPIGGMLSTEELDCMAAYINSLQ